MLIFLSNLLKQAEFYLQPTAFLKKRLADYQDKYHSRNCVDKVERYSGDDVCGNRLQVYICRVGKNA